MKILESHRGVLGVGVMVVVLGGCKAHVQLDAPDATADSRQRIDAWKRLQASNLHETHITYVKGAVTVGAERRVDYLQLAGGERVYHPEDLRPVIAPRSASAGAIDEYESSQDISTVLVVVGSVLVAGGLGLFIGGVVGKDEVEDGVPLMVAGGATAAVGGVAWLVRGGFASAANDEKSTAFTTYNQGLLERLNLCEQDKNILACDEDLGAEAADGDVKTHPKGSVDAKKEGEKPAPAPPPDGAEDAEAAEDAAPKSDPPAGEAPSDGATPTPPTSDPPMAP